MTKTQEANLNMGGATISFCDANTAITAIIPAFSVALTAYKANFTATETTAQLEAQVITGITINKADMKKSLCNSATGLAAAVYAYATSINDPILQEKSNYAY